MNSEKNTINQEITARASLKNEPLSTKQSVEICNFLRYKTTSEAKQILQRVAELKQAIPFKHSTMDLGHKRGMGPGSFPQKAAHHFLKLLQAVEANAQFQGLNTSNLKIIKLLANKAAIPLTGRRNRTAGKRTHLEIEVKEKKEKKKTAGEMKSVPTEKKKKMNPSTKGEKQ